jgi:predicted HicB family RNase H-like nuclease
MTEITDKRLAVRVMLHKRASKPPRLASTNTERNFYKATDGNWYVDNEDYNEDEDGDQIEGDMTTYGPFPSFDAAEKYMDRNFANSGSYTEDESGRMRPPRRPVSPRGSSRTRRWGASRTTASVKVQGNSINEIIEEYLNDRHVDGDKLTDVYDDIRFECEDAAEEARDPYGYRGLSQRDFLARRRAVRAVMRKQGRTASVKVQGNSINEIIEEYLNDLGESTRLGFEVGYWDKGKFWMGFEEEGWSEFEPGQTVYRNWKVAISLKGKQVYATDWKRRKVYKKTSIDPMSATAAKLVNTIRDVSAAVPMPVDPNQPDTPSLPQRQW